MARDMYHPYIPSTTVLGDTHSYSEYVLRSLEHAVALVLRRLHQQLFSQSTFDRPHVVAALRWSRKYTKAALQLICILGSSQGLFRTSTTYHEYFVWSGSHTLWKLGTQRSQHQIHAPCLSVPYCTIPG